MTTPWQVQKMWAGETVAVLASGASMTQELADSVRHLRRIAVRRAFRFAPDADMLIALDGPPNFGFWEESEGFAGLRICGCECDIDALYLNILHEVVRLGEGNTVHIRNNGLSAIRLAAMTGAAKIVLLGFDPPPYVNFYGSFDPDFDKYPGLSAGLAALVAELRAQGIEVIGEPTLPPSETVAPEYLRPGEIEELTKLIASVKPHAVVEIGCNAGRTSAAILAALPKIKSYIGVDVEHSHVPTLSAQRNEAIATPGALVTDQRFRLVIKPHGSFDLAAGDLPPCDAVFIDGDHSRDGVLNDYALAKSIVRPGGIIIFHDDNGRDDMQVTQTLLELEATGADIGRIDGTWLAFERVA